MDGLLMKYFVLKPNGKDVYAQASRNAMEEYAMTIKKENSRMADDILAWVYREQDIAESETVK